MSLRLFGAPRLPGYKYISGGMVRLPGAKEPVKVAPFWMCKDPIENLSKAECERGLQLMSADDPEWNYTLSSDTQSALLASKWGCRRFAQPGVLRMVATPKPDLVENAVKPQRIGGQLYSRGWL